MEHTHIEYTHMAVFAVLAVLLGTYLTLASRPKSRLPKIPFGLFILYFLLRLSVPIFRYTDLKPTADAMDVAATIVACMAVVRVVVYLVIDHFIRQKKGVQIASITRDFGLAIIYVIIAMIVLKHRTEVNLGSLLTTSAILTAVIGFAMQDTLGNLFSGLALQLEHPYQIGDWIGFDKIEGKVVGITWKSTKILTRTEELIFVPNNTIAKSMLTNFSKPSPKHVTFLEVGTSYNDPPHIVRKAITETILNHPKVLQDHQPLVFVTKYNDFSIDYKAFFATEDFASEGRTRFEIMNDLWYRFKRDNIRIPYPVQEEWQVIPSEVREAERIARAGDETDIIRTLDGLEIFRSLVPDEKMKLAKSISLLCFAEGETMVRQGDEPGPMYIIKEGECSVLVSHAGERAAEVASLKPGQFFGEMSLLTGAPRTATVKARTNVVCFEIEKDDIRSVFEKNPAVMNGVGAVLAKRQLELDIHKERTEDAASAAREKEKQLTSKIRSFLGL